MVCAMVAREWGLTAAAIRSEHEVPAVGRPRRIFIDTFARVTLDGLVPEVDGHNLEATVHLRLKGNEAPVG